jgi:hypothetical protein
MNVVLDGDKYLTGAAGQGVFVGKFTALEDRLLDPKLAGDAIKVLLRDVHALYVEQTEKRDYIANPTNYPELPPALRQKLVKQVDTNYAMLYPLRQRVLAKAKEANVGDGGTDAELDKRQTELYRERARMMTARGFAVDRRMKHAGAGSAGLDNPRKSLTGEAAAYATADKAWGDAIKAMTDADGQRQTMLKEDSLDQASRDAAKQQAGLAVDSYKRAADGFEQCRKTLDEIYLRVKPKSAQDQDDAPDTRSPEEKRLHPRTVKPAGHHGPFWGYESQYYGTKEW